MCCPVRLRGVDLARAVAVIGGAVIDSPIMGPALARGGHLRAGLEDRSDAVSNVKEVRRAAEMVRAAGDGRWRRVRRRPRSSD